MKHQLTTSLRILIIYLLVVVALCLLASCNPVKRVMRNPDMMGKVFDAGVEKGWCVNDSIYVSDTTVLLDTLYNIEYKSDTVTVGDSVWIDRVEYRTIQKTVTIRDTAFVTDYKRIDLLQKQLIKKDGQLLEKIEELEQSQAETKQARQERNKWRLYFWLLFAAITAFILRKPIMKLISPIKLPI